MLLKGYNLAADALMTVLLVTWLDSHAAADVSCWLFHVVLLWTCLDVQFLHAGPFIDDCLLVQSFAYGLGNGGFPKQKCKCRPSEHAPCGGHPPQQFWMHACVHAHFGIIGMHTALV